MKFLVITNAPTFCNDAQYFAYAPYVIEMDIWGKNVRKIGIISPGTYPYPINVKAFDRQDIKFFELPFLKLSNLIDLVRFIFLLPLVKLKIINSFIWADHIHLRGPGNISLIACFLQIFFPNKPKTAKYAGNWDPHAKQPWSYKLQKWILSNTFLTRNMKVLVYGQWPDQSKNILPFFTASFSEKEIENIHKNFSPPYKFLFVGNLVKGKQPQFAIQLVQALKEKNISSELHVYGGGILKNELEIQAEDKDYIHLYGNQPLDVVKKAYKESHFIILASKSEGWPKAVAEAMFFGCIPVATGVSCVPWMLGEGSRGILIPEREIRDRNPVESGKWKVDSQEVVEETAEEIIELIKDPEEMKRMSREAQEWSQEYTLEKFEGEIRKLLAPQPPKGEQKNEL